MREFADKYLDILKGPFKEINLTRICTSEEFYEKQILDSVLPAEIFPILKESILNGLHIDVGFGGGFPLVPLAFKFQNVKFLGLEARRKKAEAVKEISNLLELKNVYTHHLKIEDLCIDIPCSITFKAVGKITYFLGLINAISGTRVFFYKGPNLTKLENVPEKFKGFSRILYEDYKLQGTQGRSFVAYEFEDVPRRTKKSLVRLSQLI